MLDYKIKKLEAAGSMVLGGSLIIFVSGALLRLWQWALIAPYVETLAIASAPGFEVMQLLPSDLWKSSFSATLLYLQQNPPIPNLIYGLIVTFCDGFVPQVKSLILLASLIGSAVGIIVYRLLLALQIRPLLSFFIALIFACNKNLILYEYSGLGHFFYEQLTLLFCLLLALSAIWVIRFEKPKYAIFLGFSVALLALTRATFSYIDVAVLLWLLFQWRKSLCTRRQLLICFLLPVLFLHGGWSLKQRLVQKEWGWTTSSWGGANMGNGEFFRNVVGKLPPPNPPFYALQYYFQKSPVDTGNCLERWREALEKAGTVFFVSESDLNPTNELVGPSSKARAVDAAAAEARGKRIRLDSAAFRELSTCAQSAYVRSWLKNPMHTLSAWWLSYDLYWSPVEVFHQAVPTVLIPEGLIWTGFNDTSLWERYKNSLRLVNYRMLQSPFRFGMQLDAIESVPVDVLGFSLIPKVFTPLAMAVVHFGFILLVIRCCRLRHPRYGLPCGFSILILLYGYSAVLSNLIEYGENMRFRFEIEAIIWCIAFTFLNALWISGASKLNKIRRANEFGEAV